MEIMKIIGLIPARQGSKRLFAKNFRMLNGKLMIEYTIEEAVKSKVFDEIIVSSDNPIIDLISHMYDGVKANIRPDFLCKDDTPMVEVVLWEMRKEPDDTLVVLLQPTSPLRTNIDILDVVDTYTFRATFLRMTTLISYTIYDCTEFPKENGAFFVAYLRDIRKYGHWRNYKYIYKYIMPISRSVDVDTIEDFKLAEKLLKKREK